MENNEQALEILKESRRKVMEKFQQTPPIGEVLSMDEVRELLAKRGVKSLSDLVIQERCEK